MDSICCGCYPLSKLINVAFTSTSSSSRFETLMKNVVFPWDGFNAGAISCASLRCVALRCASPLVSVGREAEAVRSVAVDVGRSRLRGRMCTSQMCSVSPTRCSIRLLRARRGACLLVDELSPVGLGLVDEHDLGRWRARRRERPRWTSAAPCLCCTGAAVCRLRSVAGTAPACPGWALCPR